MQGQAHSLSVPCSGAVTVLQATAAPGSGLALSRPADASSSSPGWLSCMEHKALQPNLENESDQASGWAGLWISFPHCTLNPHTIPCEGMTPLERLLPKQAEDLHANSCHQGRNPSLSLRTKQDREGQRELKRCGNNPTTTTREPHISTASSGQNNP